MACTPPTSASEVFCRAAKCNRLTSRLAFVGALIVTIVMAKSGTEFIHNATAGNVTTASNIGHVTTASNIGVGGAERIVGHLTHFAVLLILQLSLLFVARRRASAAHHARVKANNLKALELLAASATDEATKKDLLARAADLVAGKPGCCK